MPIYLPGDVLFTAEPNMFATAIRFFERSTGEEKTFASHVGVVYDNLTYIEANWKVERLPIQKFIESHDPVTYQFWRMKNLSESARKVVAEKALEYVGRSYGFGTLFPHLGDCLLQKLFGGQRTFFRRLLLSEEDGEYPICSWVVAYAYAHSINYEFGIHPRFADPDTMHDHVLNQTLIWERV